MQFVVKGIIRIFMTTDRKAITLVFNYDDVILQLSASSHSVEHCLSTDEQKACYLSAKVFVKSAQSVLLTFNSLCVIFTSLRETEDYLDKRSHNYFLCQKQSLRKVSFKAISIGNECETIRQLFG